MKNTIVTVILLLSSVCSYSETIWTLEECTEYTLLHSSTLRKLLLSQESSKNSILYNSLSLMPKLNISSDATRAFEENGNNDNLQISASASLTLSTGLSHLFSHKSAILAYCASQYNIVWEHRLLEAEITASYLDAIIAMELKDAAERNVATVAEQKKHVILLVNSGKQPKSAAGQAEAQSAAEEMALVEAECNLENALLKLQSIMELPYDESFTVTIPYDAGVKDEAPQLPDNETIGLFVKNNGSVRASTSYLESREYAKKAAVGAMFPSISIYGSYGSFFSSLSSAKIGSQFKSNLYPSTGISFTIPIIPASEAIATVKDRDIAIQEAAVALNIAKKETEQMIRYCLTAISGSYRIMVASARSFEAAKELLEENQNKMSAGLITALDWIISRNDCLKAESAWIRAKWQYYFNLKTLAIYLK